MREPKQVNFLQLSYKSVEVLRQIENCVQLGRVLVITNCNGINPFLYPLLRKEVKNQGSKNFIQLGEKTLDYNLDFRLILLTESKTKLSPQEKSVVCLVNFTLTQNSLQQKLISILLKHKNPELEKTIKLKFEEEENSTFNLEKLETNLLLSLSTVDSDILENKDLLKTLAKTRNSADKISEVLCEINTANIGLEKEEGWVQGIG